MTPIIGLIANIEKDLRVNMHGAYGLSIEKSGGLPLVLPYIESEEIIDAFVDSCDGFLFTGGADVEPEYYGEEKKDTCGETEPSRDKLEFTVLKKVLAKNKPILGICRGLQLINAAMGGTLYQDIPTECGSDIRHVQTEDKYAPSHPIFVEKDTPLFHLVGKGIMTGNSFHHQAIKTLADDASLREGMKENCLKAVDPFELSNALNVMWDIYREIL
jgi:putative glutamine amidotransferase